MKRTTAFTLIELLVVIAVVALLIGILLPALGLAREAGRQSVCATNLRSVSGAVGVYTATHDYFPLAYVYGADEVSGDWRPEDQVAEHPAPMNGYVHWSFALYGGETGGAGLPEESFQCPTTLNGGAPRSNPGPNADDWEPGQVNGVGDSRPSGFPKDRQAARMAYAGNAAVFPRNKLNATSNRRNRFVRGSDIDGSRGGPAGVILATEFFDNRDAWTSVASSSRGEIKSHRPIEPFLGVQSGVHVFDEPLSAGSGFVYPSPFDIEQENELDRYEILNKKTRLNAVGRHHGEEKANFAFVDGHVDTLGVRETVERKLWGDRFYSLSGDNSVDMD